MKTPNQPHALLAIVDGEYRKLQDLAQKLGQEQLLSKAVMWSPRDMQGDPELTDVPEEVRFQIARRAVTLQTIANQKSGDLEPVQLWRALVGV